MIDIEHRAQCQWFGKESVWVWQSPISVIWKKCVWVWLEIRCLRDFFSEPVMMVDMAKLNVLIPGRMTLTFIQSHRATRKLILLQLFCCKMAWRSPDMCFDWSCKGDYCKQTMYVYELFEHLLFLLICSAWIKERYLGQPNERLGK